MPNSLPDTVPRMPVRRRLVAVLFTSQSLFSAAQIVTFAVLPIVVVRLGGSEAVAGLPATLALAGRALAAFPVGWLMDRVGRRFGLSLGFLLGAIGSLVAGLAIGWASFVGLLLGVLLAGMGRGIAEQGRFAAAEVETPAPPRQSHRPDRLCRDHRRGRGAALAHAFRKPGRVLSVGPGNGTVPRRSRSILCGLYADAARPAPGPHARRARDGTGGAVR